MEQEKVGARVALFQPVLSHYRVDLFNELDRRLAHGLVVHTVDASDESRLGGAEARLGAGRASARTYRVGPLWFVPRTLSVVCDSRWDVVVLSWNARQVEILPALLLARVRGVPVILWGQGFGRRGSQLSAWLRRLQVRLASSVITYSASGAREVAAQVPGTNAAAVTNTTGRPIADDSWIVESPKHRVAYLGRLLANKRGEHLVEAVGLLRRNGLELKVDIIGDGPHRSSMEQSARQSGVEDMIHWHGHVTAWDDVRSLLKGCDLVVLPARAGLAVVDGCAVARGSVVLDDSAGNGPEADLVTDGETGFIYGPATAEALASRLAAIYSDPDSICRVSKAALDLYRSELTVEVAADTFGTIIDEVVAANHRR